MPVFKEGRGCPIFNKICTNEECQGNESQGVCGIAMRRFMVRAELISAAAKGDIYKTSNVPYNVISENEAFELAKKINIDSEAIKNKVAEYIFIAQHSMPGKK